MFTLIFVTFQCLVPCYGTTSCMTDIGSAGGEFWLSIVYNDSLTLLLVAYFLHFSHMPADIIVIVTYSVCILTDISTVVLKW